MMRHLMKLVWNRKRTNALLIVEIFFSFLVTFAVATLGMYFLDNYRRPLGFEWQNVWQMEIDMKQVSDDTFTGQQMEQFARVLQEVRALGEVEAVGGAMVAPFGFGRYGDGAEVNGHRMEMDFNEVTQDFDKAVSLEIVGGRWFQPSDAALAWQPIVIDEDLAREAFPGEDPVGKRFTKPDPESGRPERRVIGVIRDFRQGGELEGAGPYYMTYKRVGASARRADRPARSLLIKLRPGTPAEFEERLTERAQRVAPDWSFQAKPLWQARESAFRLRMAPLAVGGTVAFFLLLMVGLGLLGVLWQNLLQRTREIGLRRATGASRDRVHRQILLEQFLLTTLGVLLGTILVVQIPILDLVSFISGKIFAGGLLVAMGSMYLLSMLCALYPSAMAARVPPAEALRYE